MEDGNRKSLLGKYRNNNCCGKESSMKAKNQWMKCDDKQDIYTVSKYLLIRHLVITGGKKNQPLQRRNLVDTTLTKWSKLTSPVMRQVSIMYHLMPEKNITSLSHLCTLGLQWFWGMQGYLLEIKDTLLQFTPPTTKKEAQCLVDLFKIWWPLSDITLIHLPGSMKGCQLWVITSLGYSAKAILLEPNDLTDPINIRVICSGKTHQLIGSL